MQCIVCAGQNFTAVSACMIVQYDCFTMLGPGLFATPTICNSLPADLTDDFINMVSTWPKNVFLQTSFRNLVSTVSPSAIRLF